MDERAQLPRIEVQYIDHLGIVAGIINAIGSVEHIDRQLGTQPQERISLASGQGHLRPWPWLRLRSSLYPTSRSLLCEATHSRKNHKKTSDSPPSTIFVAYRNSVGR